ncbi:MAG: sensor histidine kinase, partial [Gemmatimonadota bacterium]
MTREALDRAQNHLDLVTRWADDLAHEIKNPFHAMVINLELVKRRAGEPEGLRDRAEVVESELHRVHGLVDGLLKLVRPWPDTPTAHADRVVEALLPVFRARAALHRIELTHEPGAGSVAVRPEDLALVALNLMDNAIDAAGAGGRIEIRGRRDQAGAALEVADTGPGPGMDADVFDPGVTGHAHRAGLGLT